MPPSPCVGTAPAQCRVPTCRLSSPPQLGLPHCPLIVVLINLLTSIWKMEIDDMRKHMEVATHRPPPRNVGLPLPGMPLA